MTTRPIRSISEVFNFDATTEQAATRVDHQAPLTPFAPSSEADAAFSTATWFLSDGRSARSAASMAHCEAAGLGRLRRAILNLTGRKTR
jgi:hypothetical protein